MSTIPRPLSCSARKKDNNKQKDFWFLFFLILGIFFSTVLIWANLFVLLPMSIGQAFLLLAFYYVMAPILTIAGIVLVIVSILIRYDKIKIK
jgi:hypothetical protein